jgi:hypothetical protein
VREDRTEIRTGRTVLEVNREQENVRFAMAFARRVKYPMKTPMTPITVPRTPKARVIDVSTDTLIIVSEGA